MFSFVKVGVARRMVEGGRRDEKGGKNCENDGENVAKSDSSGGNVSEGGGRKGEGGGKEDKNIENLGERENRDRNMDDIVKDTKNMSTSFEKASEDDMKKLEDGGILKDVKKGENGGKKRRWMELLNCGVATQVGSLVGAVVAFLLVTVFEVFEG